MTIDDRNQENALAVSLRGLNQLAKIMKSRRMEQGLVKQQRFFICVYYSDMY